jgi:ketosteroid isomerase-like protein
MTDTHPETIGSWIAAADRLDAAEFLSYLTDDVVLDDPSVGARFEGKERVGEYFESYFVGYQTATRLISIESRQHDIHVTVEFTGTFPGGRTGGTFDLTFSGNRIDHIVADLTE